MTALNAADPQSHAAHASTRPLLGTAVPASRSDDGCIASGAAAEFITPMLSAHGEHGTELPLENCGILRHWRPEGKKCQCPLDKLSGPNPTINRLLQL